MSYTELEHGYQGFKRTRPAFYIGLDLDSQLEHVSVSQNLDFVKWQNSKQISAQDWKTILFQQLTLFIDVKIQIEKCLSFLIF